MLREYYEDWIVTGRRIQNNNRSFSFSARVVVRLWGHKFESREASMNHSSPVRTNEDFAGEAWGEVSQLCPTLWNPMDYSPPGSSTHGIFQTRILEWVPVSFSRDLLDQGIKPETPALQVDSLPLNYQGSPSFCRREAANWSCFPKLKSALFKTLLLKKISELGKILQN